MTPRTVLFPFSTASLGGSHVLPSLLVEHLHRSSGWHVRVCLSCRSANASLFELPGHQPDYLGITPVQARHVLLKHLRYYGAAWYLRTYGRAIAYLRRHRPDIVHIHHAPDLFTWGLVAKLLRIPVIWHVHTFHQKRITRTHFRLCDHVIFVSASTRSHFSQVAPTHPSTIVHNGVKVERFEGRAGAGALLTRLGLSPERLTLGFVGQLTARKRPDWAVRAAIDLLASGHDLQMIVVGADKSKDGRHARRLEGLVEGAGRQDRIRLLGQRQDVSDLMRAMDVFLFSSEAHGEAFPLVVLEAMAAGTPVVGTRSAGVPEAIVDGETGLLSSPHEYAHFLAQAERAVGSGRLREKLGCGAHRAAREHFSIERCGDRVLQVYESMMNGDGSQDEGRRDDAGRGEVPGGRA